MAEPDGGLLTCPACGTQYSAQQGFCHGCGQRVAQAAGGVPPEEARPAEAAAQEPDPGPYALPLKLLQAAAALSLLLGLVAIIWFLAARSAAPPAAPEVEESSAWETAQGEEPATPQALLEWVNSQAASLGALIDEQVAGVPQEQPQALQRWAERYGLLTEAGLVDHERATAYAAGFNDIARLKALLALRPDLAFSGPEGPALCTAAANGSREALWMLLADGADPLQPGPDGMTPLCLAAAHAYGDCVLLLAAAGGDVNAPGAEGKTPLALACASASADTVLLLLDCGADVLAADDAGNTPLHSAALAGLDEVIAPLCQHGADPGRSAADGATPLHRAAQSGSTGCIAALLAAGADREMRDAEGRTPRDIAREHDMLDAEMALGAE